MSPTDTTNNDLNCSKPKKDYTNWTLGWVIGIFPVFHFDDLKMTLKSWDLATIYSSKVAPMNANITKKSCSKLDIVLWVIGTLSVTCPAQWDREPNRCGLRQSQHYHQWNYQQLRLWQYYRFFDDNLENDLEITGSGAIFFSKVALTHMNKESFFKLDTLSLSYSNGSK
jgi:hypothetical protein